MRILFDHQSFSLQVTGGITRYFYQLATCFNQVEGVATDTQLGFSTTIWPMEEASKPNGSVLRWGERIVPSGVGTYLLNEVLLNAYNLPRDRVEIYHNTLYRFMPGIKARCYVATHHDCTVERFPNLFPEAKLVVAAKRKMFKKADLIFSVSAASRDDLLEFYDVEPSRIIVLTNPPSPLPRSPEYAVELRKMAPRPFLLYVGTRVRYKNFDGLLKAFAASGLQDKYDLLAIGGGPLTPEEMTQIHTLGVNGCVLSVPLAPSGLLAEAYAEAAAFIYPSFYEGLGLPPLEAMEKGCPVLASANPACLEVCKDAALFFDPFSQDDLIAKLRFIVEDGTENKARVQRGYQVREMYSWDFVSEKMLAAYRSML